MPNDLLGFLHLASAFGALAFGLLVLLLRKGTPLHRQIGYGYVAAMAIVNVTALMIYDLFGGFGPFHLAALISLVTLVGGIVPARRRPPPRGWLPWHAYWMSWSYVGLLAALVAETATRMLEFPFGLTAGTASLIVFVLGAVGIGVLVPAALGRTARGGG